MSEGLLGTLLGGAFGMSKLSSQPSCGFFQDLDNERLGHGFEPIDWPTIIVNQYRAEALTRPMTVCETFLYDGAVQTLNKESKI